MHLVTKGTQKLRTAIEKWIERRPRDSIANALVIKLEHWPGRPSKSGRISREIVAKPIVAEERELPGGLRSAVNGSESGDLMDLV